MSNAVKKFGSIETIARSETIVDYARLISDKNLTGGERKQLLGYYLEEKARQRAIPVHGTFELTPFCNLDCKMCYVHLSTSDFQFTSLLKEDNWICIMDQAYRAGMRKATLTGGECLTYPDFDGLYLFLHRMGVGVSVLTNGVLLNAERIDFFKQYPPEYIQLSLYGSNEMAYEKVTGHRVFNIVLNNLKILIDSGLKLQVSITPNSFMLNDIGSLIKLLHSLQVHYEINCQLIPPRKNTGRHLEDMSVEDYLEIYRLRAEYLDMPLYPTNPTELPDINQIGKKRKGLMCGAGRSSFAVNYYGEMMPCVSLNEYSVSIKDEGFSRAWQQINHYSKEYPLPCECFGCAYAPICVHCQGHHKDALPGHCNPKICERTKKLAEAGFYRLIKND